MWKNIDDFSVFIYIQFKMYCPFVHYLFVEYLHNTQMSFCFRLFSASLFTNNDIFMNEIFLN